MSQQLPAKKDFEKADAKSLAIVVEQTVTYATTTMQQDTDEAALKERTKQGAELLIQVWSEALNPILVDVCWQISCLGSTDQKAALQELISSLMLSKEIPPSFARELQINIPDLKLLGASKVVDETSMAKKIRKVNTELYYKQSKYNLLQEESEGYAKLLSLLFGSSLKTATPDLLKSYIGTFDLDPNRVLDLLLDLLETKPAEEGDFIINLMQEFSLVKIPHLLNFKITSYQLAKKTVPASLYTTIVLLAEKDLLDLANLVPSAMAEFDQVYSLYEKYMKQKISSLGRISLSNDGKQDAKEREARKNLETAADALERHNALAGLLNILLSCRNWKLASKLLTTPEEWTKVCTIIPAAIGKQVSDIVLEMIAEIYDEHVTTPNLSKPSSKPDEDVAMKDATRMKSDDEKAQVLDKLLASISTPLIALAESGCLMRTPILFCKLCRLVRAMIESTATSLSSTTYRVLQSVLVPSLTLASPPSPALSAELWSLLSILPYATRYQLYRDWKGVGLERAGSGFKSLVQVRGEMEAGKAARYTLKRLSVDNVRDMGRQVSKVTHSNPLVVFTTILNQIESYDNLIQLMVETVRFVTPLSLDVMGYCILGRLHGTGGVNRSRLKDDGLTVTQWLQSLESFAGAFYRRCPDVEFRGLLTYLMHRVKGGNVLELGVLKTLIKVVGGFTFADYSPAASISTPQLVGRAGSMLLRRETFSFGIVDSFNFRAMGKFKSVLQGDNLGVTLLILLAQVRTRLVFEEGNSSKKKPVKLVANLLDTCQVILNMLVEFMTDSEAAKIAAKAGSDSLDSKPIESYASSMPSLRELFEKYKLDHVSAWMLCRPIYRAAQSDDISTDKLKAHLGDRKAVVLNMLPKKAWELFAPDLFDRFFLLSLYDIFFPESSYEAEIGRLADVDQRLAQKKKKHQPGVPGLEFSRDDELTWQRVQLSKTALSEDMSLQKKHCADVRKSLAKVAKAGKLFSSDNSCVDSVRSFITYCIYPRCLFSPDDAAYCIKFASVLNEMETPGFSMIHLVDELTKVLSASLYSSTEDEAAAIGLMLLELWKIISEWRYNDSAFEKDLLGKPGSMFVKDDGSTSLVTPEEFKVLYNRWHAAIGEATLGAMESGEYMHVRACFVVLSRIVDAFPTRPKLGKKLLDSLEPLQDETYPLQDIKTAAQAYGTLLVRSRTNGVWKEEDAATIKAREDREKSENVERQKRREEQFQQMKRDTEKINAEIGESEWDNRDRRGGRGPVGDTRRPVFEPPNKSSREGANGAGTRDSGIENGGRSRVEADRGRGGTSHGQTSRRDQLGLDGRWERGGQQKRERSPARGEDQPPEKRTRMDARQQQARSGQPNFEPPPNRGNQRGEPRRQYNQRGPGGRR